MNYQRTAAQRAKIDQNTVKKWKSELRRMTRIYKSLTNGTPDTSEPTPKQLKEFREAKRLFHTFATNFESFIFDQVMPSRTQTRTEPYGLRKTAWRAYMSLADNLFPSVYSSRAGGTVDAPWKLVEHRAKKIRAYQRAFNAAFKDLEAYIEVGYYRKEDTEGVLNRFEPIETYEVSGINVVVHNAERAMEPDEATEQEFRLKDFLSKLRRWDGKIKKSFPKAMDGLTIHIKFGMDRMVGGMYQPGSDTLTIKELGLYGEEVFIHEMGHRVWFRDVSPNARKIWKEVIGKQQFTINAQDAIDFVKQVIEPIFKTMAPLDNFVTKKELQQSLPQKFDSPRQETVFKSLARHWNQFTSPEEAFTYFRLWVGDRVQIKEISNYGSTNPEEAFAEAFALYVGNGPRALDPWSRWFFKEVSMTGGAKFSSRVASIASRVARRILAGEFQPPPAMVKAVTDWALSIYAGHVLFNAEIALEKAIDAHAPLRNASHLLAKAFNRADKIQNLGVGEAMKFKLIRGYSSSPGKFAPFVFGVKRVSESGYLIGLGEKSISWRTRDLPWQWGRGPWNLEDTVDYYKHYLQKIVRDFSRQKDSPKNKGSDIPTAVDLGILKRKCLKYTSKPKTYATKAKSSFPVDVSGWKYLPSMTSSEIQDRLKEAKLTDIDVVIDWKGNQSYNGYWDSSKNLLLVSIGVGSAGRWMWTPGKAKNDVEFQEGINRIKGTIGHELRHVGQDLIRILAGSAEDGGLPSSSIRDPDFKPSQLPPAEAGGLPVPSSGFKAGVNGACFGLIDDSPSGPGTCLAQMPRKRILRAAWRSEWS